MALPNDLTTCTISFGPYTDAAGAVVLVGKTAKLYPVDPATGKRIRLVHVATGQEILPADLTVTIGSDGTGSVGPVPHTDNPGLSTVGFAYRVEWDLPSGARSISPGSKTFAVPQAAGATVDFDLLDVAEAVPGVLVPMQTTPHGGAGGALSGEYPNPGLNTSAVDNAVAGAVADEDSATREALTAAYARTESMAVPQLVDVARRGRFGGLGTSGKGVVSLRFDHQLDPFLATIQPLLDARRLPFSIGLVTRAVGNLTDDYEPTAATWADVKTKILAIGGEVWSHSRTHGMGSSLYDEIVNSKSEIETQGIRAIGWQQPGGTYGVNHTTPAAMNDEAGRLIRETYGLYESSIAGSTRRTIPTEGCWGHNHITIDTRNAATVKGYIDEAVNYKTGIQLMLHPAELGRPGFISVADFTAVLDYLVTLRDTGKIEVLTGSALAFADPGSTRRPSLTPFGDFEGQTTGTIPAPWTDSGVSWTIGTDGGHGGSNYLRIPSTGGLALCNTLAGEYGLDGFPFMLEGWVRGVDATTTSWRAGATALIGSTNVNVRNVVGNAVQGPWVRVRVPFTIPVGASLIKVYVGRNGGGAVDWDDVSCVAI